MDSALFPDDWDESTREQFTVWEHALQQRTERGRGLIVEAVAETKAYARLLSAMAGVGGSR